MIIAVPKETAPGETRVALTPDAAKRLVGKGLTVRVERGAGTAAGFLDDAYAAVGCELAADRAPVFGADVVLTVQPPAEPTALREGVVTIGILQPFTNPAVVRALAGRRVTSFSLDLLPRITRAQSMDVLSSMSTVAGYKAVLLGATALGKFFPMLMTAAGTVAPARVFVLGAGVAGLQAIATARRLGAVVEAFDVRPAVKEQVESLGAKFVAADVSDLASEGEGGYAKEMSEEQHRRELELIHARLKDTDVVITTALIPGKPAPVLITEEMVRAMKPGSVIVDLAAEMGGNCALTAKGKEIVQHGVTIIGRTNLAATTPQHASQMYARNLSAFLDLLVSKEGTLTLNFEDEIIKDTCITHDGRIVHDRVRQVVEGGGA
ncbi:MAG: Re/Si-specific NAD(P)(+) transhydrogenase subunit alpha [Gemmatimonadota bacterium]|nr:Re/Si-specific NAD(P)(+) transhydrogenase subunit alpha [Gemmatimonadota bacterium]